MVEFAIMLPLLIILLLGISELGRALYQLNTLTKAVNTGTRYLARMPNIAKIDEVSGDCAALIDWSDASPQIVKAKQLVAFGSGTAPLLPGLNQSHVTVQPLQQRTIEKYEASEDICVIRVRVEVPFVSLFGGGVVPFTDIGSFSLNAEAEERYIGL